MCTNNLREHVTAKNLFGENIFTTARARTQANCGATRFRGSTRSMEAEEGGPLSSSSKQPYHVV